MSELTQIQIRPEDLTVRTEDDFSALLDRFRGRAPAGPGPNTTPDEQRQAGERTAAQVRIDWFIPPRHRYDVLERCPSPVPAEGLPAGRCRCQPWRHFVPQNQTQEVAFQTATKWAEGALRGSGVALALIGPSGTGKSHLMYGAIRMLNLAGINAGAWGWYDLTLTLKSAKFSGEESAHQRAVFEREKLFHVQAFALDEIRPTSGTEFDATELSQLMTRAYRQRQSVLITTNFADAELEEVITQAATSRLTLVTITGPDYRNPTRARLQAVR